MIPEGGSAMVYITRSAKKAELASESAHRDLAGDDGRQSGD